MRFKFVTGETMEFRKVFDTIRYPSVRVLAESLNVSSATVKRIFDNPAYAEFISIDKSTKTITLFNHFPKGQKEQFVRLTAEEVSLIREVGNNLFAKYLIYQKCFTLTILNNIRHLILRKIPPQ